MGELANIDVKFRGYVHISQHIQVVQLDSLQLQSKINFDTIIDADSQNLHAALLAQYAIEHLQLEL
jgi:hypothetical protein